MEVKQSLSTYKNILKTLPTAKTDNAYFDAYTYLKNWLQQSKEPLEYLEDFRKRCNVAMKRYSEARMYDKAERMRLLIYEVYKLEAPYHFDAFMLALEYDRPVEEQFYLPRRKQIKKFVDRLQDLTDDKLDELFLSCPARIGKTTLLMMFALWVGGRNTETTNLYCTYSNSVAGGFYDGLLEIIGDKTTYHYLDIFPNAKVPTTNGKDAKAQKLNLGKGSRYYTFTCRGIDAALNGECDANGIIIADDLVEGYEEAINKDRLVKKWGKVNNDLIPRAKENCKILWCGTRWSLLDPIGTRVSMLSSGGKRYVEFNVPALDEHDESNFHYMFDVGFSTEYYKRRRSDFEHNQDMASWFAQYMGQPIEREGALFAPDEMRYFDGVIPQGMPDRVFMACDIAFGGGDFCSAPVCVQFGQDVYVVDVLFSNLDKTYTQPALARLCKQYDVQVLQLEANKTMRDYVEGVQNAIRRLECHTTVQSVPASPKTSKEMRIFDKAPDIRNYFIFLQDGKRSKEYQAFMQNVYSFTVQGKNKHDDAPDSLVMAANMMGFRKDNNVRIVQRPF